MCESMRAAVLDGVYRDGYACRRLGMVVGKRTRKKENIRRTSAARPRVSVFRMTTALRLPSLGNMSL